MMMTGNLIGEGGRGGGGGGGGGPCGACKFLRRKCVKGCIFAPYFDAEQGTSRFAAVHKVFGASNASKMLMRLPLNKRRDAVITLCFEALARLHDPVYGSVGHLFSLQHQVMNLQAELAHVQARLSTIQRFPLHQPQESSLMWGLPLTDMVNNSIEPMVDKVWEEEEDEDQRLAEGVVENGELQEMAMQFVSRYLPAVKHPACTL